MLKELLNNISLSTVLAFTNSFLLVYFVIPNIRSIIKTRRLTDVPDHRSSHKVATPTMAGVAFFITLIMTLFFIQNFDEKNLGINILNCISSIDETIKQNNLKQTEIIYIDSTLKSLLTLGYTPPVASQFYLTESLIKVGGYDSSIKTGVDHDLWITMAAMGYQIRWLNKVLVKTNDVPVSSRMTFDYSKRINGISNTIKVWENKYSHEFRKDFFKCLRVKCSGLIFLNTNTAQGSEQSNTNYKEVNK